MWKLAILLLCSTSAVMCENVTITSIPTPITALALDNPYYDVTTSSLYTGDVLGLYICRFSYITRQIYCCAAFGVAQVAFVMPLLGYIDRFLVGAGRSAVIVEWDGISVFASVLETLFTLPFGTVLNSALVGPDNSLYIGTYGLTLCVVNPDYPMFRYTRQTGLVQISRGFESTVGMFIVQSTRTFYQLDGCSKILTAFNWDPCTGAISNQRQVIHFRYPDTGILIGFAGDCRGHLYTGFYNGSIVVEIDPTIPAVVNEIKMPVALIGAPTFGDPCQNTLYLTSTRQNVYFYTPSIGEPTTSPPNGDLFMVHGLPGRGIAQPRPFI